MSSVEASVFLPTVFNRVRLEAENNTNLNAEMLC